LLITVAIITVAKRGIAIDKRCTVSYARYMGGVLDMWVGRGFIGKSRPGRAFPFLPDFVPWSSALTVI